MPKFYWQMEQRSREWFDKRRGKLTASNIDKIITPHKLEPSKERFKHMNTLLAEWWLHESIMSTYESQWMTQGREWEKAAQLAFELETDSELTPVGCVTMNVLENEDEFLLASPDSIWKAKPATVELKAPAPWTQMGYMIRPHALSDEYRLQVQTQLLVCEYDKAYAFSFAKRQPSVLVEVGRDEKALQAIDDVARQFCEEINEAKFQLSKRYGEPPTAPTPVQQVAGGFGMLGPEDIAWIEGGMK